MSSGHKPEPVEGNVDETSARCRHCPRYISAVTNQDAARTIRYWRHHPGRGLYGRPHRRKKEDA